MKDRKKTEESEGFYQSLLKTAIDGFVVTDSKGNLIEVNDAYCRLSGYTENELLSMHISDLDAVDTTQKIASKLQKAVLQGWDRFESRHRRKDGSIFDVSISTHFRDVENGHHLAFIRDISDRKEIENERNKLINELQEREERFRLLSECSAEIMYQLDLNGQLSYISPAVEKVYGYTPKEILNLDHTPFFPESEYERVAEAINKTLEGENFQLLEFISKKKDNSFFPVEISFTPTIKDDNIIGIQGITRDITERKQAEQALSLLNETLEQQVADRTADLQRVNQILMDRSEELAGRTASLEEVNTALKVLLREYEHQQTRLGEKVVINLNELTRPHLARLGEEKLTPRQRQLLEAAVGSLDQITSPLNRRFILEGSRLTPTESQVAGFIRQGKTTKEIAEAMEVSIRTVEDHRQNIRKKLRLNKKKINLQAYLQSLS